MQIIQSIRDKGAAIVIAVIALSLIGFILMDAKQGNSNPFRSMSTKVGKVNGDPIELAEFNKRVKQVEDQEEQRSGQRPSGTRSNQLREQMWNQLVAERIFFAEAEKLGINFNSKELSAILLSNDPSNPFLQEQGMVDPATGRLDMAKAQEALVNIKKFKGEQRDAVDAQIIEPLKLSSIVSKYSGLISAAAYYPTWMQEKETAETKAFATIAYVAIPYSDISDSAVTVTDADVNAYVQKNKELFKQEDGRRISYVAFSQLPNAQDSSRVREALNQLKASFVADTNAKAFIGRNSSTIEFDDTYKPKSKITSSVLDTILKQPQGVVYGPYADQGSFVLAKVLGSKSLPDSVKARHILIGTMDPQTRQQVRDDSSAKKLADSILVAVKGGADFAALAAKYSSDGSKDKGGDLGTFGFGQMVPEFNDFTFNKPVGSKEVVKTQFGYHVIDIIAQTNFNPAYKIAFLGKEITASDATINNASLQATKAAGEKDAKALAAYAQKNGVSMTQVPTLIKENDFSIGGLQDARPLVKWAFDAKLGDVSEPFSIGDQFVVATVDKIEKEGVQDAATARSGAEVIIRKQKKAAMIKTKLGASPTLESAAAAYGKTIQQIGADSSLTMNSQVVNGLGMEHKLIGASFNKDYQAKPSPAFEGTNAVYIIKVLSIQNKPADSPQMMAEQAANRLNSLRSQFGNWYEGLKKQATIKDKRSEIF
ncbi:MAG: peptidylprolyl isomerase [Ferruginibacter sp.]|nr:peptidylprolyl isomerase [Ferruginibacter sp.]